jgi:hypothetical protein
MERSLKSSFAPKTCANTDLLGTALPLAGRRSFPLPNILFQNPVSFESFLAHLLA